MALCDNSGCMPDDTGHMTQNKPYALSIQCHYHLTPGCMAHVSSKWHHIVTTGYGMTDKMFYPSCHPYHIIIMPAPCNLSENIENWCSKPVTISIRVLLHSHFDQKLHKDFKCSALPLVLAIYRSIYYLLNSTFNKAHDVSHLINQLLLMLQQYITRSNDFKHCWFTLLLSGLLRSPHISLWFLIVFIMRLIIVAQKLFWFQKIIYSRNLIIKKTVVQSLCLLFICFSICIKFITLSHPLILLASDQNIKSTTSFVGGGRSARTDYDFLKPYVMSVEVQLKNPDEFSYVHGGHCTVDKAMQEIQTSGEAQLVCNIPLALVANILTSAQANEVAKEHNLHALSRKSLAEKRAVVESHVCTRSCNRCVTMFKPVKKNEKSIQHQHITKAKPQKVGRKSWGKGSRIARNHKYYNHEKVKFPPSPPSKRLMHKIISGFCNDTHPGKFEEAGCAVCGQLVVLTKL